VEWKQGRLGVRAEQASLSQVLGEIARRTGLEIRGKVAANRKVSAAFSNVSLREGLHKLLGPTNYALLEKGAPSVGGAPTPFALVLLPQGVGTSAEVKTEPKPADPASNKGTAASGKDQAPQLTGGATQPPDNQAAAATAPDDSSQRGNEPAADAIISAEANPGGAQAAQTGAAQQGVNGAAPVKVPPALPNEGVSLTSNRPAPANIPDAGVVIGNSRSAPLPIPDRGLNLDLQQSQGKSADGS
jgi:hypothetical protein